MRSLNFGRHAVTFLDCLPPKPYRQVMGRVIDLLTKPDPHDARPIKGFPGLLRIDIGEYRIAFTLTDDSVHVPVIDKRNDDEFYKILNRQH